jgi:hypothetical protein
MSARPPHSRFPAPNHDEPAVAKLAAPVRPGSSCTHAQRATLYRLLSIMAVKGGNYRLGRIGQYPKPRREGRRAR